MSAKFIEPELGYIKKTSTLDSDINQFWDPNTVIGRCVCLNGFTYTITEIVVDTSGVPKLELKLN